MEALDRQIWEVRLKTELVLLVGIRCQELLRDLEEENAITKCDFVVVWLLSCPSLLQPHEL